MTRAFLSILAAFSISLSSGCASEGIISENAIGPVYLGLEKSKVANLGLHFTAKMEESEGVEYEVYVIEVRPGVELTADFDASNRIAKLTTSSPFFVTTEGARVGTSLDRLREIYPDGKLFRGSSDYGLQFNFTGRFPHHVFVFDANQIGPDCVIRNQNCPDDLGSRKSVGFYMFSK